MGIFNFIIDPILWIAAALPWTIFVSLPFLLLEYITYGLEIIAMGLPSLILFGSINEPFSYDSLPYMFGALTIISIATMFIFFIIVFIRFSFQNSENAIESAKVALKYSFLSWVYIILIPLAIFILYFLINWVLSLLGVGSSPDTGNGLGTNLFLALQPTNISDSAWEGIASNSFLLDLNAFKNLGGTSNYVGIVLSSLILGVAGIGVIIAYFMASVTVVIKMFEQFFLFVSSPIIASTSIIDGGKRIQLWRDLTISKAMVIIAITLGARIYISLLEIISTRVPEITNGAMGDMNWFFNQIIIIILAIGGAFAFVSFGDIVAQFVGESAGMSQGRSSLKALAGTVAAATGVGKVATTIGKSTSKAISIGKNTKNSSGSSGGTGTMMGNIFKNASNIKNTAQSTSGGGLKSKLSVAKFSGQSAKQEFTNNQQKKLLIKQQKHELAKEYSKSKNDPNRSKRINMINQKYAKKHETLQKEHVKKQESIQKNNYKSAMEIKRKNEEKQAKVKNK